MIKRMLIAFVCGAVATFAFLGLSAAADECGYELASQVLFWQNGLLQSLVPPHNIGSAEHPVYEGSPLNFFAFLASLPLGILVYGLAAFAILNRQARRNQAA